MHRNISGVRFTVSFLALLLVVFLSACSSVKVAQPTTPPPAITTTAPASPVVSAPSVQTAPSITPVAPKAVSGTFHEKVAYDTPEGSENVDFVFTVDSGMVKDLTLISTPNESQSKKYQSKFMSSITSQVVGKKISEIGTFDRVGGASLTTPAFNQAVTALKTQS